MKIVCQPGYRTDFAPASATPFWYYGLNVRFRLGVPETVGLFSKVLRENGTVHARVQVTNGVADLYSDQDLVIVASGLKLTILDWVNGTFIDIDMPADVGDSGRWWFTSTETEIICGRTNYDGLTYVIPRDTFLPVVLPNAPPGGMGGGIVNGILLKAGTAGVAGDGPNMVVRWSARRTDPSSSGGPGGPFGFEDWTPSDLNASGEFLLEDGSGIVGATTVSAGFVVWTDTRTYLLAPRNDLYVFTLSKLAQRGLLSPKSFGEADGRLWWWDQTRTLNVFDGGGVRQIPNPMRHASIDRMVDAEVFTRCGVSVAPDYGEVILHYPDRTLGMIDLVYNYIDDAWYVFALERVAMTSAHGDRPSIGVDEDGFLYFYDLRELLAFDLGVPPILVPPAFDPPPGTPFQGIIISPDPEPFTFFLMTNHIAMSSLVMQSLRARNLTLTYSAALAPDVPPPDDQITVATRSYGTLDLAEAGVVDEQTRDLGQMLFPMRAGGKMVQLTILGVGFRSLVRFGEIDLEAEEGGEK